MLFLSISLALSDLLRAGKGGVGVEPFDADENVDAAPPDPSFTNTDEVAVQDEGGEDDRNGPSLDSCRFDDDPRLSLLLMLLLLS